MASTATKLSGVTAAPAKDLKIRFIFSGFKQDEGFRVFFFEDSGKEHMGSKYSVRADLSLARRLGIPTQDLPLLCRAILERGDSSRGSETILFSEAEMNLHVNHAKSLRRELLLKKKSRFKPPSVISRVGWRSPQSGQVSDRPERASGNDA